MSLPVVLLVPMRPASLERFADVSGTPRPAKGFTAYDSASRAGRRAVAQEPTHAKLAAGIWSVADLLRGDYKRHEYGPVILAFTLLRRLEPTRSTSDLDFGTIAADPS